MSLFDVEFTSPDGELMQRDVVRHPGAVSVVALKSNGNVVMVRQFRAPMEREMLEIPAGKRDVDGEPPEVTAVRELVEEVGLRPGSLVKLIEMCHSPGFCDEINHIFLATDLEETERQVDGPEERHMTIVEVPLVEVFGRIARGEITDAKSVVGLTLAAQRLGLVPPPG